jgi:hypothetical protein
VGALQGHVACCMPHAACLGHQSAGLFDPIRPRMTIEPVFFSDHTADAIRTTLMVSLQKGTLPGRLSWHSNETRAITCYNLIRHRHTTVMLACIIMDTLPTFHQTLHSGTMQRAKRLTEQAAPLTENAPFVIIDITEGFGMAFRARGIACAWAGIAWIHAAAGKMAACLSGPSRFFS